MTSFSIDPVFIIIIAVVGLIIFLIAYFNNNARVKRKLKKAPVKRVSSFYAGDVAKVVGKVELVDEPLIAPLSGRPCACYHIIVEQQTSSGKNSNWHTIINETKHCKYLIRDGNAHAMVDDRELRSYIVKDKSYRSGFLNDATDVLERYLNQHGLESENMLGMNKTIRYKEGVLEKGEEVAVYGKGNWKQAEQLGLPDYYGRVLVLSSPDDDTVYLSDDPSTLGEGSYN
nr:hypothetical protein [uncultured Carboxylicivirga sp.]